MEPRPPLFPNQNQSFEFACVTLKSELCGENYSKEDKNRHPARMKENQLNWEWNKLPKASAKSFHCSLQTENDSIRILNRWPPTLFSEQLFVWRNGKPRLVGILPNLLGVKELLACFLRSQTSRIVASLLTELSHKIKPPRVMASDNNFCLRKKGNTHCVSRCFSDNKVYQ